MDSSPQKRLGEVEVETMNFSRSLFLICLLSCTALLASAQEVKVDYDRGSDFSKYKTYAWQPGERAKSYMHQQIIDALDSQLLSHGLKKVEKDADLHLVYITAVINDLETSKNGGMNAPGSGVALVRSGVTSRAMEVKNGMLLVELSDASTKKTVWSATAKDTLSSGNSTDFDKQAKQAEKTIRKAVEKMFRKFPVSRVSGKS
jgi:hypothetical protein